MRLLFPSLSVVALATASTASAAPAQVRYDLLTQKPGLGVTTSPQTAQGPANPAANAPPPAPKGSTKSASTTPVTPPATPPGPPKPVTYDIRSLSHPF